MTAHPSPSRTDDATPAPAVGNGRVREVTTRRGRRRAGAPDPEDFRRPTVLSSWAWFLAKNVLGWVLIVASFLTGWLPGPGGIPLFLIGFGLVTFPGKRRIVARMLRGTPVAPTDRAFRIAAVVAGFVVPLAVGVYLLAIKRVVREFDGRHVAMIAGAYAAGVVLAWFVASRSAPFVNWLLRMTGRARRKVRPWLRHHGIDLLPPRYAARRQFHRAHGEVIEVHDRFRARMRRTWNAAKPWLRRIVGIGLTVAIFAWILKPIVRQWDQVRDRVLAMNYLEVLGASVMFAVFLFVCRVLGWRRIIKDLGNRLPVRPATRIWSASELARYLPGGIWQIVGRAYLCKPYGVRGRICSTSQVVELSIFLLANLIMATACLLFLGWRNIQGTARFWLVFGVALVPVLMVLLHPRIFYPIVNRVLARTGRPPLERTLHFRRTFGLLVWYLLGLAWQGLAIWVVTHELLGLPVGKWWVVTGAYCLAWCAGFLAVWAPGGIGVREAVFIAAMDFALPLSFKSGYLADMEQKRLFLIYLSVLLRIWATVGELMLTGVAYALDYRGALGRPDAPGRVGKAASFNDDDERSPSVGPSPRPETV